jgi:hypothetical protein
LNRLFQSARTAFNVICSGLSLAGSRLLVQLFQQTIAKKKESAVIADSFSGVIRLGD